MKFLLLAVVLISSACQALPTRHHQGRHRADLHEIELHANWEIQNSAIVSQTGGAISQPGFATSTWIKATVPSTVLANLVGSHVGDGTPSDVYMGKNWLKLPGSGPYYPIGLPYDKETPPESPFGHPWWYRTEFQVSASESAKFNDLVFNGITYGAEIWLNGKQIANPDETKGTYRHFSFPVSLKSGTNTLAVLVYPPLPTDLTASWVDWNITPQDKNMGLWREVFIHTHGPVRLRRPFVNSEIHLPGVEFADLTIEAELTNESAQPVTTVLHAKTLGFDLTKSVTLAAHELRHVSMAPSEFPQLHVLHPDLWWPWQMGEAKLNDLSMDVSVAQAESDSKQIRYGIRKMQSTLTPSGARLFSVNGKPIFVRGGGWASDLLLRFNEDRQEQELNYVRQLGLNLVRLEGRFETEHFLDLADEKGILTLPGWVCCNSWQSNSSWSDENNEIAGASLTDQLYEYRQHASTLAFLYGSDEAPPHDIEQIYLAAISETHFPNPTVAAASGRNSDQGPTGVKMEGPYAYVPPSYWYADKNRYGGAYGFNTETSPGVSMPPMESLKQFIPAPNFAKLDEVWDFHLGENDFSSMKYEKEAVERRYGPWTTVADFVKKAEVMDYDNHRAMFESYAAKKYQTATGIVQWMLNNSWPSILWHLYDFYLRPNAAFDAVKKANTALHAVYNYDDRSIVLVNALYKDHAAVQVTAKMVDLKSHVFFTKTVSAAVKADSTVVAMQIPEVHDAVHPMYFVLLQVTDSTGAEIDENIYWLSQKADVFDWFATDFKITPMKQEADLSLLATLPITSLNVTSVVQNGARIVTVKNTGASLAFFVYLRATDSHGVEILPIEWSDNHIALMPGETRVLTVRGSPLPTEIHGRGWNVSAW